MTISAFIQNTVKGFNTVFADSTTSPPREFQLDQGMIVSRMIFSSSTIIIFNIRYLHFYYSKIIFVIEVQLVLLAEHQLDAFFNI